MAKKNPAIDQKTIDAIRNADHFVSSIFLGRGVFEKRNAKTIVLAIHHCVTLNKVHSDSTHRNAMIYAVDNCGGSTFVSFETIHKLIMQAINSKGQD